MCSLYVRDYKMTWSIHLYYIACLQRFQCHQSIARLSSTRHISILCMLRFGFSLFVVSVGTMIDINFSLHTAARSMCPFALSLMQ